MIVAVNATSHSLNTLRIELVEQVDTARASLDMLRENATAQLDILSMTFAEVNSTLFTQIEGNSNEIISLANEAGENHNRLATVLSDTNTSLTNKLSMLQEQLTQGVEQVTTRAEELEDSLSNTIQVVSMLNENVQQVRGQTENLVSSQNHTLTDLHSLRQQVEGYHSDATMTVGSKSLYLIAAIGVLIIMVINTHSV